MRTRRGRKPKRCLISPRLLERRRAGQVTLREMAAACGVCVTTVWRELRRLGFPADSRRGRPRNEARRHQVATLRARGLTFAEIAQRLKVSKQRAHQLLREER